MQQSANEFTPKHTFLNTIKNSVNPPTLQRPRKSTVASPYHAWFCPVSPGTFSHPKYSFIEQGTFHESHEHASRLPRNLLTEILRYCRQRYIVLQLFDHIL